MLVLIVDSSIQIIDRLEQIISEIEGITLIHRAFSYEEAKKLYRENRHAIVILDIDLPDENSLKLLAEIKMTENKTRIIGLFSYPDDYLFAKCKFYGVDPFIDKYYDFEKLYELPTIRRVKENSLED
jgi:DNA-binding NarL/FixJ family response regulator